MVRSLGRLLRAHDDGQKACLLPRGAGKEAIVPAKTIALEGTQCRFGSLADIRD
jgi:hypothetical protein